MDQDQEDRLMWYLMGLHNSYDHTKDHILLTEPLRSLDKVYSLLCKIEKQNEASNDKSLKIASYSVVNFVSTNSMITTTAQSRFKVDFLKIDKNKLKCEHCNGIKHTKDTCFKIYGYPEWWKEKYKGKLASSSTPHANHCTMLDIGPQDKLSDEMDQHMTNKVVQEVYLKMIKGKEIAYSSIHQYTSNMSNFAGLPSKNPTTTFTWIADSGASAHMCHQNGLFENMNVVGRHHSIHLPNGSK